MRLKLYSFYFLWKSPIAANDCLYLVFLNTWGVPTSLCDALALFSGFLLRLAVWGLLKAKSKSKTTTAIPETPEVPVVASVKTASTLV